MKNKIVFGAYALTLGLFSLWTWILTAPNLVLSSSSWYWNFQTWLWNNLYSQRDLIASVYFLLIILFFICFFYLIKHFPLKKFKHFCFAFFLLCMPLLFSFNALSFDVFNYLFNAKMVVVYQSNPHQKVALDFPDDPWVRFMHNTHTAAPYGYAWTGISVIPYYMFQGKFSLTWISFRALNLFLLALSAYFMWHFANRLKLKKPLAHLALFFFNPLILVELLSNFHNDLWMMLPAFLAITLLYPWSNKRTSWPKIISALLLFAFSLNIKFATLALLPALIFLFILPSKAWWLARFARSQQLLTRAFDLGQLYFFDFCAGLMFLPLLTSRSQFFHPWYLVWSLTFIPFVKNKIVQDSLLILSLSSLLRYLPFLWENGYAAHTLFWQQLITWMPLVIYFIYQSILILKKKYA